MSVLGLAYQLRSRLAALPRRYKRLLQIATDVLLLWAAIELMSRSWMQRSPDWAAHGK